MFQVMSRARSLTETDLVPYHLPDVRIPDTRRAIMLDHEMYGDPLRTGAGSSDRPGRVAR